MEFMKPAALNVSSGNLAENFKNFKEHIDKYLVATETSEKSGEVQVSWVKNLMGSEALNVYNTITKIPKDKETVKSILGEIEAHLTPKKNETIEVFKFLSRRQGQAEPFDKFYMDLKDLLASCDFGNQEEKLLKAQVIVGINSKATQERLLREEMTLEETVEFCKAAELAESNMKLPEGDQERTSEVFPLFQKQAEIKTEKISIKTEEIPLEDNIYLNPSSASDVKVEEEDFKSEELIHDVLDLSPSNSGLCPSSEDISSPFPSASANNTRNLSIKPTNAESSQECDNKSVKSAHLKKHIMTTHTKEKPFSCYYCDYRAVQSSNLKAHVMAKHTKEKPRICTYCGFSTFHSSALRSHIMAKHTKEKPFSCSYCDYRTAYSSTLKSHIMTKHTKEKPFSCTYCDYRAVRFSHLRGHIMVKHTKEKPVSCTYCDYRTTFSSVLKRHIIAKHAKEEALSCTYCDYITADSSNLKRHIMIKHSRYKKFSCYHCNYCSMLKASLKLHIVTKHSK